MPPDLAAQLVDPADAHLSAGSNTPVQWRCPDDQRHVWTATPNTRRRSPKCPVCLNKVVLPEVNSLRVTDTDLAAELVDPSVGEQVHRGAHAKVDWACAADPDHPSWSASVVSRTRLGSGCPYCSGRLPVPGRDDLDTTHPDLAAQLVDPSQAALVGPGSSKKLTWRCAVDAEHTWDAPVRNRAREHKPTGCPECAGRSGRKYRHLPTLGKSGSPLLSEAVDPEYAATLSEGSGKEIAWRCTECGGDHEYVMSVRHRRRGQGCPVKAGTQVLVGVNDLATTHPKLAAQLADPTQATSLSRGSVTVADWRCAAGHVWRTPVYARVAGNGCPTCCPIGSSYGEQELLAAVRALDPDAEHRARLSCGTEVDVLTGSLAIEFNGVFWHSEAAGRTHSSHRDKLETIRAEGLSMMTVWEDDWADEGRRAIIVRTIAHRLARPRHLSAALKAAGVPVQDLDPALTERRGARTLSPTELTGRQTARFFRENHVQGPVTLTRSFALVDEQGRPRAVLGLRSPKHNARARRAEGLWEIQRYATCGTVPGGFTRLLEVARRELVDQGQELTGWVTLSADESSEGHLYAAAGFTPSASVPPSYWYSGGALRARRAPKEAFQLRRFRNDENLRYEEGWSELEAAAANRMYRVWDAGKTRWTKML